MLEIDLDHLEELTKAATQGEWHPGCFADKKDGCQCKWILTEGYMGSIATIEVDNGLEIRDGGNDSPPEEEARANLRFIAATGPAVVLKLIEMARRSVASAPKP